MVVDIIKKVLMDTNEKYVTPIITDYKNIVSLLLEKKQSGMLIN